MGNSARGEHAIEIDGAEYTLRMSINAICELEDRADRPIEQIGSRLTNGDAGVRDIRLLWWAALRDHHADVDLRGAGVLIEAIGLDRAIALIGETLADAFPANGAAKKKTTRTRSRGRAATRTRSPSA